MELVSVIVPVYQVREYLMECVQSIQEQTYTELEIILVDDGSTDGSEEICDKCVINDKRISVIHQKNQGLSVARNNGLRHAKGRLIAFVDADDVVDERYIEVLYEILAKYEADIAVCDYVRFRTGEGYYTHRKKGELLISSQTMLRQWHGTRKRVETVAWNKLYRREVLRTPFPEGKLHEDIYTSHLFIENAKRIAITKQQLYYYRLRKNSITNKKTDAEVIAQDLEAQRSRMQYFREKKLWGSYIRLLIGHMAHRVWYRIRG
ncbi:MAG: glycosyltransferase [Lachnospiraceae bacterium]|nr:glycosyltransferase [Lachnospiraceae bacterium]